MAFVWDYTASWTWAIEPYSGVWDVKSAGYTGAAVSYLDLVYLFYSACEIDWKAEDQATFFDKHRDLLILAGENIASYLSPTFSLLLGK